MPIYFNTAARLARLDKDSLDLGAEFQPPEYTRPEKCCSYPPIVDAKESRLSSSGTGKKTGWISAKILRRHLDTGELTSKDPALRELIRQRGVRGEPRDDCGLLIASRLGGKMVEFNLFHRKSLLLKAEELKSVELYIVLIGCVK